MNIQQQLHYRIHAQRSSWLALIVLAAWCLIALTLGLVFVEPAPVAAQSEMGKVLALESQLAMQQEDTRLLCATRMMI